MIDNLLNSNIGRYHLEAQLGGTDIIQTYKAYDSKLERYVLLKILVHSKDYSENFTDYFLREARSLAQLSHPGIAKVFDFGRDQGYLYLVLEFVTGKPLSEILGTPVEWRKATDFLLPIADALAYAHESGIIHRDLAPENIIINEDGQPVLRDFSVARIIEDEETRDVTGTNAGFGSPTYMSPEQGKGMPVDYRADIYSLGIIFFELITGKPPFSAENNMEILIQQVMAAPPNPRKYIPDLPISVERAILTCLKKDPDERFQSVQEFSEALKSVQKGREYKRPPRSSRQKIRTRQIIGTVLTLFIVVAVVLAVRFRKIFPLDTEPALVEQPSPTANQMAAVTETVLPTIVPTSTPTEIPPTATLPPSIGKFEFPDFPRVEGEGIIELTEEITAPALSRLVEVHRLGKNPITQISWMGDESSLIAGTGSGIYFYNPETLSNQGVFNTPDWVSCYTMSLDETQIAVGSQQGEVFILDALKGTLLKVLTGHTDLVTSVSFSPDGLAVTSSSKDRTIRIWNLATGDEPLVLKKHTHAVNVVQYGNQGKWLYSGADDFHIIIWDSTSGDMIEDIRYNQKITDIAVSTDNALLAVGLGDSTTVIRDISEKRDLVKLNDDKQVTAVTSVSLTANKSLLATGSLDGVVRIWNVANGKKLWDFQLVDTNNRALAPGDAVLDVVFSGSGTRLAALSADGQVKIWTLADQKVTVEHNFGDTSPRKLAFTPDNARLLIDYAGLRTDVWEISSGSKIFSIPASIPTGNVVSPNNRMAALLDGSNLTIYSFGSENTYNKLHTLYGFPAKGSVSFSDDNRLLFGASSRSMIMWSTLTGYEISSETYKFEKNCRVAYSKDDYFLGAGSVLGTFLNPDTYLPLCELSRNARMSSYALSLDQTILSASLSPDIIQTWETGQETVFRETKNDLLKQPLDVAISPDKSIMAVGTKSGTVVIIQVSSTEILAVIQNRLHPVIDVEFSYDGHMLAVASEDGTIGIWAIPEN